MRLDERPVGPVATTCVHGVPDHVPCGACTVDVRDETEPCRHGTTGDCGPCDRAADVDRTAGPRSAHTFEARHPGNGTCRHLIFVGDLVMRDRDSTGILCARCTAAAKGTGMSHPSPTSSVRPSGAGGTTPSQDDPCR